MNDIDKLNKMIKECKNIVAFTGAGVSTESGIKDFRSKDGLYNMKYDYPPEEILSHHFFINNTKEFYKFYVDKLNTFDKKPNVTHKFLKDLEESGKLKAIITQNIDGLHEMAGSTKIVNLHGSIYYNHCMKCGKEYNGDYIFKNGYMCACGGTIKPDVVLYEEALKEKDIIDAVEYISKCDMLLVLGSSLTVYPASSFIDYFRGKYLVIINKDTTNYDRKATLVINDSLKNVIPKLDNY